MCINQIYMPWASDVWCMYRPNYERFRPNVELLHLIYGGVTHLIRTFSALDGLIWTFLFFWFYYDDGFGWMRRRSNESIK